MVLTVPAGGMSWSLVNELPVWPRSRSQHTSTRSEPTVEATASF